MSPQHLPNESPAAGLLRALAALARGAAVSPDELALAEPRTVAALAERHGIGALAAERARTYPALAPLAAVLSRGNIARAAADLVAGHALREALHALHRAGVPVLVFKGAQLAHAVYEAPHLRPRLDSDLLVLAEHRTRAHDALRDLGYHRAPQVDGDLIMFQEMFVLGDVRGPRHVIDLHWRVTNPHEFGPSFESPELMARAVPIPALGPDARGLSTPDALMVSLIHPVAHHGGAARLIWDLDTAALAERMTAGEWAACLTRLDTPRLSAIAFVRLSRAVEMAGAVIEPSILARLREQAGEHERDALAAHGRTDAEWQSFARSLRALPGWRERARFLQQHLAPPAAYMRTVYAPGSRAPLPALYAARAFRGLRRWLGQAGPARRPA